MEARIRPLVASLVTMSVLTGFVAFSDASPSRAGKSGPVGKSKGAFHVDCQFSHRLPDDPIVFPRGRGASHSHDFFGARNTDAFSTNDSIRRAPTNCVRTNTREKLTDRSAYWVPTLYVADQPVDPYSVGVYYKTGFRAMNGIVAFPEHLRVIAGDSKGIDPYGYDWRCKGKTLVRESATSAPLCQKVLVLEMRFPDCWDGTNTDSRDHKSHMAYSIQKRPGANTRVCPSTHPRAVPQIEMIVRYPTMGGPTTRLASGGINTAHADFMNGWVQKKLTALVNDCLKRDKYCGGGDKPVPGHQ